MNMAIQREIWMNTIVEGLFADNSFLNKAEYSQKDIHFRITYPIG
jgi:hypothetical protein